MTHTIAVISDIQAPFEDRKALKAVLRFIGDYQPDEVVQIGDLADYPQPSRWNKDTRGEFEGSIYEDSKYIRDRILTPLRAVYSGPIGVLEGNHDLRPREYLSKYAPALTGGAAAEEFNFGKLLDFDGFGITHLPDFHRFAPGWLMTHGHLGGIRLTQQAGMTALKAAERFDASVIMGHTHRVGKISVSKGVDGEVRTLTGVEVGNLMDMRQAKYLKRATGNWQQGFALVHVDGRNVQVTPVMIQQRRFIVEGVVYTI